MDSSNCNSVVNVLLPFRSRFACNRLLPFHFVTVSQHYHFVSLPFRAVPLPFRYRVISVLTPSKSEQNGDACTVQRSFNEDGT